MIIRAKIELKRGYFVAALYSQSGLEYTLELANNRQNVDNFFDLMAAMGIIVNDN